jgi:methylthioribose-1-phosphate isomerase
MRINNINYRTIWLDSSSEFVRIVDQTLLPHRFEIRDINTLDEMVTAIVTMQVRGAPLIGAAAAYGLALAMREDSSDTFLERAAQALLASRPTAVNLRWAILRMLSRLQALNPTQRKTAALAEAALICDEDVTLNQAIGQHGLALLQAWSARNQTRTLNILTHCNAGWLATVDWGTALAPIYAAFDAGMDLHVWVDETRPRNQGASLTAWELGQHGVPHTVITDNAGGHLMQIGQVDMVIVGADRVTNSGDVCNKIGTYLKALAAFDNHIPFYVAVPSPTIDWTITHGLHEITIEARSADEVAYITGRLPDGTLASVNVLPAGSAAANPAFDVTPARLVTGIITERGVCAPNDLRKLFSEH